MKLFVRLFILYFIIGNSVIAQEFNHQDTLRGSITPERAWWDVTYYHLKVAIDIPNKHISGSNLIQYKVLKPYQTLQIELQEPLKITRVVQGNDTLELKKDGYSYFITLKKKQVENSIEALTIFYEGFPQESKNPPWSGGFTWKKDENGKDWVVTTCQGDGASLWWPNKDHAYDEPDSMRMTYNVPIDLMAIGNGKLEGVNGRSGHKTHSFSWFVCNPINNYGVNLNIGDYAHFSEKYEGIKGELNCEYYVLRNNLEKAKKHFKEVPRMLKAFEYWFGPYPFYEDGYKLVEVPYAGMEHQSSVTYGNKYANGYLGRDVSGTGWGNKFDFIIVHESGHEWFANNITHKDVADMWVHESFTSYSENLFLDFHFGTDAANEYVQGVRKNIMNDRPIIGVYDVHQEGSADMYYKGANVLHTLRQLVENDSLWREVLKGLNEHFYHQTVSGKQVEDYISEYLGKDLSAFFNQYLRSTKVPTIEYVIKGKQLSYRYVNVVDHFDMPVRVFFKENEKWIFPTNKWKQLELNEKVQELELDPNFYVYTKRVDAKTE